MKKIIRLTEEAENDIFLCAQYIRNDKENVAERFLDSFSETTARLLDLPKMGRERKFSRIEIELVGLREFPLIGFEKFLVFYRENEEGILVIRLLHKARNLQAIFSGMNR